MYRGIEAIEHFMESIGLSWRPGATERAELKVSYRIGNTRPLGIDRTLVEFHCDPKRAKVWVQEFSRNSFHHWFEVPYQEFVFTPGGSMLKIKSAARGNAPPYSVGHQAPGLTAPLAGHSGLYMIVVPSSLPASRGARLNPGITPTVR